MAKNEVKIRFAAETKEFSDGIKKVNSDLTKLRSELKLNTTQLQGNANDSNLLKERQRILSDELEISKDKIELTNQKLEKAKEIYGENSIEVSKLETALNRAKTQEQEIQNEINKCTIQIQKNEAVIRENENAINAGESTYEKLTNTIQEQTNEFEKLKKEYVNAAIEQGKNSNEAKELEEKMKKLSGEINENTKKVSDAEKATEKYEKAIREAGEEAQDATNGGFTVFKGILSDLGSQLIGNCIEGIKQFGASVIETGMEFEAGMSQVAAISGATGESLDQLKEKAAEMGMTTKYTSADAAEAMNYMAMAGWKAEDMLAGIEGIMNLASASGEELGTTSDIVTDALTAFGMSASESAHFADVMAAASANANTNVSMLGESFQYAAPVAGALGYSVEDTSLALGLMANSGIKASMAGTSLRTLLTNLAKPTDAMSAAMDQLGISLQNENGSMKTLKDLMQDLRGSLGECKMPLNEFQQQLSLLEESYTNGEITEKKYNKAVEELTEQAYGAEGALKAKYAATLAGKTGMSGLLAIVNASEKDFNKLETAIYGATDAETGYSAAGEMARIQMDNLRGDLELMDSAFDGLKEGIADDLNGTLRETVQNITNEVVPALQEMYTDVKEGAKWLNEHETAVTAVVIGLGSLTAGITAYNIVTGVKTAMEAAGATSLWGLAKAQLAVNTAMLTSPVTWIVAAVVALGAALVLAYNKSESFRNVVNGLGSTLKNGFLEVVDGVKDAIGGISEGFSKLKEGASQYVGSLKDTFTENGGGIQGAAAVYMKLMTDKFKVGYDALNKLTGGKLDEVKNKAVEKFEGIKDKAGESLGKLKDLAGEKLNGIKNTFNENGGGIKGAAAVYMELMTTPFRTGYAALNKLTGGKLDELKNTAVEKLSKLQQSFKNVVDKIKQFFTFEINIPKIKMPSIVVTYDTSGTLAKAAQLLGFSGMPKFSIKWNAEGAILTRPTVFGFANGMWQGGGEAGPEAVLPIEKLQDYIDSGMAKFVSSIPAMDYDKIEEIAMKAVMKADLKVVVDGREIGRVQRSYAR